MRTHVALVATSALALAYPAAPADGGGGCHVEITTRDEIIRSGDVEIGPGEHARKVGALSGSVRVKPGAAVEDVVALSALRITVGRAIITRSRARSDARGTAGVTALIAKHAP